MLTIVVTQEQARVPVTVMSLDGELDAASYLDALETARKLIADGTSYILLDLESLTYMGSSGLFVMHSVAMMLRGDDPPDPEGGWGAIHQVEQDESDLGGLLEAPLASAAGRSCPRSKWHEALFRDVHGPGRGARLILSWRRRQYPCDGCLAPTLASCSIP